MIESLVLDELQMQFRCSKPKLSCIDQIKIYQCDNRRHTLSTINLHQYSSLYYTNDIKLGVEIILNFEGDVLHFSQIFKKCIDRVAKKNYQINNMIVFKDVVSEVDNTYNVKHVLFIIENHQYLDDIYTDDYVITFLDIITITNDEYLYMIDDNYEEFRDLILTSTINFNDLHRDSLI